MLVNAAADVDDSTLVGLLTVAGQRAPFVLVVDDKGWASARDRLLASFAAGVPTEVKALGRIADGPGVVAALGRELGLELGEPKWEGHDASRPIVVSMMEPPFDGPPGAAIAQMSPFVDEHPPIRHQVVIPASDPAVLVGSLRAWAGADANEVPRLVEGLPGAVGLSFKREWPEQRFVALIPEGQHVRVVVLDEGRAVTDPGVLRSRLVADVSDWAQTPAVQQLVDAEAPLGVLVRPWQLRALGAWAGNRDIRRAIDDIDPDYRDVGRARGMSIAAVVEILTPDTHAELDDVSVAIEGGDDLKLTAVASLTPHGREVWRAGQSVSLAPLSLQHDVAAEAFINIDTGAMLAAAPAQALGEARLSEFAYAFQNCGFFCPAFAGLRWPLSAVSTAVGPLGGMEEVQRVSRLSAVQFVLLSLEPEPKGAVAIVAPPGQPAASLGELLGEEALRSLQVHGGMRGDSAVTLVGMGVDPRTVFELERGRSDFMASDALASFVWSEDQPVVSSLRPSKVSAELRLASKAVTAEVVVGGAAPDFRPDYTALRWPSPQVSGPSTTETDCLRDGVDAMRKALENLSAATDEEVGAVTAAAVASLDEPLRCARADQALAPMADNVADIVAVSGAAMLVRTLDFEAARRVLAQGCKDGGAAGLACERLTRAPRAAAPPILQRDFDKPCLDDWRKGLPLTVGSGEVTLGGQVVAADSAAIVEAIMDVTPIGNRVQGLGPTVELIVAADTPMRRLVPIVEALAATESTVKIAVLDKKGKRSRIPLSLAWASTLSVDWSLDPAYDTPPARPRDEDDATKMGSPEFTIHLDASGPSVERADGEPMRGLLQLDDALADRYPQREHVERPVGLAVADDVAWRDVVDIATLFRCDARLVLTPPRAR